jgi:transcriptional regulator with XRE-family HTH domain
MSLKINEQIMALRKQKGITQSELADVLGVSNQSVSKWESGQCCPDIQLLPDLAEYFGVSVDELMGLDRPQKESKTDILTNNGENVNDPLLDKAIDLLGNTMLISTSVLQRKLGVAYRKAAELIQMMTELGHVVEIRPGFYQRVQSQQDHLRLLLSAVTALPREDQLNLAMAMHAACFGKMSKEDISTDGAVDTAIDGKWGYSAVSEPDITTVMRAQSVFYSKNRALDFNSERIGELCGMMKIFSDRQTLTVMATIYELTVHAEDAFVGIEEIAAASGLPQDEVRNCLNERLFTYVREQAGKCRIKGEKMSILPILSILCY